MTDHQSSPVTSEPLLVPEVVLQEARSLHRFYSEKPDKPYTSNVLADCIATIENLLSRIPDAAATTPHAAALTERLIDAAVDYERATGIYAKGARHELSEARAAVEAAISGAAQPSREAREKEITRLATIEECARMADGWLAIHGDNEIQYTSAREYASDAVADIADAIRGLAISSTEGK